LVGFEGGAMDKAGEGAEALWAEFKAGKEGGGRLSSSSSSSELSWAASVKVGTSSVFWVGVALGVVAGDEWLLAGVGFRSSGWCGASAGG
jgi:hypothetical protein